MGRLISAFYWRPASLVLLLVGATAAGFSGYAAPAPSRQSEIEAVLLFNLARFVDWPPDCFPATNAPLVLGIMGTDPFGTALDKVVAGEMINGHPIAVLRFSKIEDAGRCHVLFINSSEKARITEIIAALKGLPVLTVSDEDGFCRRYGGMVGFYVNEQKKVRLRLNLEAAKFCRLHVSSKLIQVAELEEGRLDRVRPGPELPLMASVSSGTQLPSAKRLGHAAPFHRRRLLSPDPG